MSPLVTIALPVYNEERYLAAALDLLLAQTFTDFTLFISDNASTDRTAEICRAYQMKDPRVVYFRHPENVGAQKNFEGCLRRASTKYFMWAAADDEWDADFLRLHVQALEADDSAALAFCEFALIDEESRVELERRRKDYSGSSAFLRLVKFAYRHDDVCIYGLFRRDKIADMAIPVWWGVNRTQLLDTAYPMLAYALSRGAFHLVGDRPLFFKRIHRSARWLTEVSPAAKKSVSLSYYFAFLLRNLNAFAFSVWWSYQGSRSWSLALAVAPFFLLRYAYFAASQTILALFKLSAAGLRRVFTKK